MHSLLSEQRGDLDLADVRFIHQLDDGGVQLGIRAFIHRVVLQELDHLLNPGLRRTPGLAFAEGAGIFQHHSVAAVCQHFILAVRTLAGGHALVDVHHQAVDAGAAVPGIGKRLHLADASGGAVRALLGQLVVDAKLGLALGDGALVRLDGIQESDAGLSRDVHDAGGIGAPHVRFHLRRRHDFRSQRGADHLVIQRSNSFGVVQTGALTIENNRIQAVEQWVLAPLRWEALEVDLTTIAEPDEVNERLLENVRGLDAELSQLPDRPNAVGLRVGLAGSTNLGVAAYDHISEQQSRMIHTGEAGIQYFVECVHLETSPEVNLQELANEPSPAGLLARRLLQLENDEANEEYASLVDEARNQILEEHRNTRWRALGVPEPDANAVKDLLRDAGMRLLDRMLAQRREEAQ